MGGGSAALAAGTRCNGGRVAGARTRFGLEMAAETFVPASHFTSGMSSAFQLLRALQLSPPTHKNPTISPLTQENPTLSSQLTRALQLGCREDTWP